MVTVWLSFHLSEKEVVITNVLHITTMGVPVSVLRVLQAVWYPTFIDLACSNRVYMLNKVVTSTAEVYNWSW